MDLALQGYDYQDCPTAADPKYDSAFTQKQKSLDEDEAKKKIGRPAGKSLDEVKAALGDVTVVEQFNDTVAAGQVVSIEFKDGVYIVYVSKGPDPATATISASVVGMSKDAALQALSAAGFGTAHGGVPVQRHRGGGNRHQPKRHVRQAGRHRDHRGVERPRPERAARPATRTRRIPPIRTIHPPPERPGSGQAEFC